MPKTTLTYTFTGKVEITFDEDAPPDSQFTTQLTESLESKQEGFPQAALPTFWVQYLAEQKLEYRDTPLAYYLNMRLFNPDTFRRLSQSPQAKSRLQQALDEIVSWFQRRKRP